MAEREGINGGRRGWHKFGQGLPLPNTNNTQSDKYYTNTKQKLQKYYEKLYKLNTKTQIWRRTASAQHYYYTILNIYYTNITKTSSNELQRHKIAQGLPLLNTNTTNITGNYYKNYHAITTQTQIQEQRQT